MLSQRSLFCTHFVLNNHNAFKCVLKNVINVKLRCSSAAAIANTSNTKNDIRRLQNALFDEEKKKQQSLIPRVKKIEVVVTDIKPEEEVTLMMNAFVSTPYNCAQHLNELFMKRSIVAEINGKQLWDMNRPLTDHCKLRFRHLKEEDTTELNRVFWRSCSFLLGMVVEHTFKDDVPLILHSWPKPNINSGSFVYDIELPTLSKWKPNESELRTLTSTFWKIRQGAFKFERLDVSHSVAKKLFAENKHKLEQLNSIKEEEHPTIAVYRVKDHIDYSIGPMIPDTSFVGRVTVSAVHRIHVGDRNFYRFQAVAIPAEQRANFFAFKVLTERAKKVNTSPVPSV